MSSDPAGAKKGKRPRISISVDRRTGQEFSNQAERAGRKLSPFANEWLATASRISEEGGTADRIARAWKISSLLRDVEIVPLPAELVEEMVGRLCKDNREKALATFGTLGEELVSVLKIHAPDLERLVDLARGFAGMTPLKKLDVEWLHGDSILVNVVGAGRKPEVTECAFEFLKSILRGYGYAVTAHELGVGTMKVEARRRGQPHERRPLLVPA